MELKSKKLFLNKDELIAVIKNNRDKKSKDIDNQLIRTIDIFYGRFSVKQLAWITAKVNYIMRYNKLYKDFRKMDDIVLL